MAGNANSGNRNGRANLSDKVRKAMTRAIKQGESGAGGQRPLSDLLAQLMQEDVAKFIQITGPFIPKEIILDQSVSITLALEEARSRLIDLNALATEPLLLPHHEPDIIEPSESLRVHTSSQGEV